MNLTDLKSLYARAHPGPGMLGLPIGAWDAWDAAISDAAPELFAAVEERDALRKALTDLTNWAETVADYLRTFGNASVGGMSAASCLTNERDLRDAIAAAREATKEKP